MKDLKAIILAAGEGSRMRSKKPKVLHTVLNRTMIDCVIDAAKGCGAEEVCVVVGHKAEDVRRGIQTEGVLFALQAEQKGTGHAVMMAADFIEDGKDILILYGDIPLLRRETLTGLIAEHKQKENAVTVISSYVDDPTGYGRIIRNQDGGFQKSVEHKDATQEERDVYEINTGIYIFQGRALKASLAKINNNNAQGEYYLPDCLEILLCEGERVDAVAAADAREFFGVNNRVQLAEASSMMQERINRKHMENGVTILDMKTTYIDEAVKIQEDTTILPGCILEGNTTIGEDCIIGPNCRLTDMNIGNGVTMQQTTAIESTIGNNVSVGPYAYIRPNCVIGDDVKVGDFVEIKNSTIGKGTKIPHLTYVGDTDAGERVNFGCGSIMVNYDGKNKHRTTVEDNVFVGCNVNLVAPLTVKKDAYIAAGSTITKDVAEDVLAVARARQQVIEGWQSKRIKTEE